MLRALAARPLVGAGIAAVAGVLLIAHTIHPLQLAGGVLAGTLVALAARRPALLAIALAFGGGGVAAIRMRWRTDAVLRASREVWPRGPPRLASCVLRVRDCAEDPFRHRAWVQGLRPDGTGVLCAWTGHLPPELGPGAQVRITGRFYRPRPPSNPGEQDRRRDLAREGIGLLADLRVASNVRVLSTPPETPRLWLQRLRYRLAGRLRRLLAPRAAATAAALLLGIRSGITEQDLRAYAQTGTLHLLAISGLHILLLAGLVHLLLKTAGLGPRTAALATLALALLYLPVAGGAPPIRRAVTVLIFYGLALVRGRPPDSASALGGAALVLALLNPADALRTGFHLSFSAAGGIALLAPGWRRRWSERHRLLARFPAVRQDRPLRLVVERYVLAALPVSLAAWCATQGLVARAFGSLTPLAPIDNVVVGPILGLLLPLLALLAAGGGLLARPVGWLITGLHATLGFLGRFPGSRFVVPIPTGPALGLWALGVLNLRRSWLRGSFLILIAGALPFLHALKRDATVELLLFDVGHGQALLLRNRAGGAVLIDAGSRGRRRLAARVLRPALRELGVTRLALVVCTDSDTDHWRALPMLLATVPVGRIVVGVEPPPALLQAARRAGVPIALAVRGQVLYDRAGLQLSVLADGRAPAKRWNDHTLALLARLQGRCLLLPADRQEEGVRALLARPLPRCEVLVAPHHGGRCAEAAALGKAVRPQYLLVSCERGFADETTVKAYGAKKTLRTARNGAVRIVFPKNPARRLLVEPFFPLPVP